MLTEQVWQVIGSAVDLAELNRLLEAIGLPFATADAIRTAAANAANAAAEAGFVAGWECHRAPERLAFVRE